MLLIGHDVAADVVVEDELFDLRSKHLVSLVLALDAEVYVGLVVNRALANSLPVEVIHRSVQRNFVAALAEVNV